MASKIYVQVGDDGKIVTLFYGEQDANAWPNMIESNTDDPRYAAWLKSLSVALPPSLMCGYLAPGD